MYIRLKDFIHAGPLGLAILLMVGLLAAHSAVAQSLAVVFDKTTQAEHISYIDAAGTPTLLDVGNPNCCRMNGAVYTVLSSRDTVAFVVTNIDGTNPRLLVHRLSDGALESELAVPANHDVLALSFDAAGDRLLALAIEPGVSNLTVFNVDIGNASWTELSDFGDDCCALQVGLSSFDEDNRIWHISARNQSSSQWSLYQFNAVSNTLSSVNLAQNIWALEFIDGAAYGLVFDATTRTTSLATINVLDGSVTTVGAGLANCCELLVGVASRVSNNDTLQFIARAEGDTVFSLYTASLLDGNIQAVVPISDTVLINAWLGNSRPFIAQGGNVDVQTLEDSPPAALALTLTASDVEAGGLTWSISESASEGTAMVSSGLGLQQDIEYQGNSDYFGSDNFRVEVMDATGDRDSIEVSVTVLPVNDAPSFSIGPNQTHNDDVGAVMFNAWATNLNVGAANEAGQQLSFAVVGNSNPALFDTLPSVNTAGDLSYTVAAGAGGTAQIDIQLMDDGGTANGGVDVSIAQSFTVTVNSVSPVIAEGEEVLVAMSEDATPIAFALSLNASDPLAGALTWSIDTAAQMGLASVTSGTGNTQDIHYTPNANANGQDEFYVRVQSSSGRSDTIRVLVDVAAVNDAPSYALGPDIATPPNAGAQLIDAWAQSISAGPSNESAQTLSFIIESVTQPALFDVLPAVSPMGALSFTPAPGVQGETEVSLRLMDDGGSASGGVDTTTVASFNLAVGLATTTNLSITLSDGVAHVDQNGMLSYNIVVVNTGFEDAIGANIVSVLPAQLDNATWSCVAAGSAVCTANGSGSLQDVVDLPVGSMLSYQLNAMVIGQEGESILSEISIQVPAGLTDVEPSNNRAEDETVIGLFYDSFEADQ